MQPIATSLLAMWLSQCAYVPDKDNVQSAGLPADSLIDPLTRHARQGQKAQPGMLQKQSQW